MGQQWQIMYFKRLAEKGREYGTQLEKELNVFLATELALKLSRHKEKSSKKISDADPK
jgi:hypothetical protein